MSYSEGDRVEVLVRDAWLPGRVKARVQKDSGILLFVSLDDGRQAICASEKGIRHLCRATSD